MAMPTIQTYLAVHVKFKEKTLPQVLEASSTSTSLFVFIKIYSHYQCFTIYRCKAVYVHVCQANKRECAVNAVMILCNQSWDGKIKERIIKKIEQKY
jgi:hypothetical protein